MCGWTVSATVRWMACRCVKANLGGIKASLNDLLALGHARADLDAAWIKGFGQSAHLMALVEDGLSGGFGFRDLVLGVVGDPQQLVALATRIGPFVCWSRWSRKMLPRPLPRCSVAT
jgi:hypothetical protein